MWVRTLVANYADRVEFFIAEANVAEAAYRDEALARIGNTDDWPALAMGPQLECAIWTEDKDLFGTDIAT